jgi:hypothetical protein
VINAHHIYYLPLLFHRVCCIGVTIIIVGQDGGCQVPARGAAHHPHLVRIINSRAQATTHDAQSPAAVKLGDRGVVAVEV